MEEGVIHNLTEAAVKAEVDPGFLLEVLRAGIRVKYVFPMTGGLYTIENLTLWEMVARDDFNAVIAAMDILVRQAKSIQSAEPEE